MVINIVVAGAADSKDFALANSVVWAAKQQYRQFFTERKISIPPEEYPDWLSKLCAENNWKHNERVIIWLEIGFQSGPKELIGGLDPFLEYMYETFKVRKPISKKTAKQMAEDNLQAQQSVKIPDAIKDTHINVKKIVILNASHPATGLLVHELVKNKHLPACHGLQIHLFDFRKDRIQYLTDLEKDANNMEGLINGRSTVVVQKQFEKAMEKLDILIILGEEKKKKELHIGRELTSHFTTYKKLAEITNPYFNENTQVIFVCMDFICYNATVFCHFARNLNQRKVIAVTGHLAMEPCSYISKASGVPLSHILHKTINVWGFVGISHIIDLANGDIIYNMMRFKDCYPPPDFLKMKESGIQHEYLGEDNWILRRMEYIIDSLDYLWVYVGEQKECLHKLLNTRTYISQVRATLEVLNLWHGFHTKKYTISGGITSNGQYGFPKGLFMSQPIHMNHKKKEWRIPPKVDLPKDMLSLKDLWMLPLSIIARLNHGKIFPIIINHKVVDDVKRAKALKEEKEEQERLEKQKIIDEAKKRLEEEELGLEEEVEAEGEIEIEGEEGVEEEPFEEEQTKVILEEEKPGVISEEEGVGEEELEEEEDAEVNPDLFLDGTNITDFGLAAFIEQTQIQEFKDAQTVDTDPEGVKLLRSVRGMKGRSLKEVVNARRKELYPPNGLRKFEQRIDRKRDPIFNKFKPKKFTDVPDLTQDWDSLKNAIKKMKAVKQHSRDDILKHYAERINFKYKAKERKYLKELKEMRLKPVNEQEIDITDEYNIEPHLQNLKNRDECFLGDLQMPEFDIISMTPPERGFTESTEAYKERCFLSKIQTVEDIQESILNEFKSEFNDFKLPTK